MDDANGTEQRRAAIAELERAFLAGLGASNVGGGGGGPDGEEPAGRSPEMRAAHGGAAAVPDAERNAKYASMKGAIGIDIEHETLQALLDAADGDEELALDVFFAESSRAAHRMVPLCAGPACPSRAVPRGSV